MAFAHRAAKSSVSPGAIVVQSILSAGALQTFDRHAQIYARETPVDRLFQVVSGMVRTSRDDAEGRRQIGGFYGPGDVFGLETGPSHEFAAEALTDCELRSAPRRQARATVGDRDFDAALLELARHELRRAQHHIWILGQKNAREKVYAFLATLAKSSRSDLCRLPMGRQDIADYLGLTLETVSRMLTQLQADAVVEFASHRAFRLREKTPVDRIAA